MLPITTGDDGAMQNGRFSRKSSIARYLAQDGVVGRDNAVKGCFVRTGASALSRPYDNFVQYLPDGQMIAQQHVFLVNLRCPSIMNKLLKGDCI